MSATDHIAQEAAEQPSNLTMLQRLVAELPAEDRAQVEQCAIKIRSACREHKDAGPVAVALVGAEMDEGA